MLRKASDIPKNSKINPVISIVGISLAVLGRCERWTFPGLVSGSSDTLGVAVEASAVRVLVSGRVVEDVDGDAAEEDGG